MDMQFRREHAGRGIDLKVTGHEWELNIKSG